MQRVPPAAVAAALRVTMGDYPRLWPDYPETMRFARNSVVSIGYAKKGGVGGVVNAVKCGTALRPGQWFQFMSCVFNRLGFKDLKRQAVPTFPA